MGLLCLIILALCGIGMNGAGLLFSQSRERYADNGIRTELVQTREEEGDSTELSEGKL